MSPADGDVWIMTSVSGARVLQVGKANLLTTHLIRGYQYGSGAWVIKELYLRSGGAWLNMNVYLYSRGTEFVTVHGFGYMTPVAPEAAPSLCGRAAVAKFTV